MNDAAKFAAATIILSRPVRTWAERKSQIDEVLALDACDVCDGPCEYTAIGNRAPKDNHELSVILAHTQRSDYRPCGE